MLVFCLRKAPTLCAQPTTLSDYRQVQWSCLFGLAFCVSCFTASTRVALIADPHELQNDFTVEQALRVLQHQTIDQGIACACSCCIMLCHAFLWTSRSTACNSSSCSSSLYIHVYHLIHPTQYAFVLAVKRNIHFVNYLVQKQQTQMHLYGHGYES